MKKRFLYFGIGLIGLGVLAGLLFSITLTRDHKNHGERKEMTMENSKTLIVYYSRTGNTKAVAKLIQEKVGGTLFQIETATPRPSEYQAEVDQNEQEQAGDVLPTLKTAVANFASYDRIFVGAPTWNMALPQAVVTFLNNYDFTGKTVIPFNTHGGYGAGSTFDQVKSEARGARVLSGFSVEGGLETNGVLLAIKDGKRVAVSKELDTWLKKMDQKKE
jgi:flavodoxin